MTPDELKQILDYGREQTGVEFKGYGAQPYSKSLLAKVVRALLSMANKRDGGYVIVGVDEDEDKNLVPTGLSDSDLIDWRFDSLADSVAQYADPGIKFDAEIVVFDAKNFLVISVSEFEDIPVLCKRDYTGILRQGACYVRPRRKPETTEIGTQTDMRDLLDLATTKALRKFIATAFDAGVDLSRIAVETDSNKFDAQLGDLLER